MQEWCARADLEVHLLDPLAIIGNPRPVPWTPHEGKPNIYCIGRMERRKGNDLFVEMTRWLDKDLFGRAFHVGPPEYLRTGKSSREILESIAQAREVNIGFLPNQGKSGMESIYGRDSVVVLPVRYDSFNLVALEALFSGCPTVVSTAAGVCDYLDERFPSLPYVKLDMKNFYGGVSELRRVLMDYTSYRKRLLERLSSETRNVSDLKLRTFYENAILRASETVVNGPVQIDLEYAEKPQLELIPSRYWARRFTPPVVWQRAKRLIRSPKESIIGLMLKARLFNDAKLAWHAALSLKSKSEFRKINRAPENNLQAIQAKIGLIHSLADSPLFRCNIWRELARLERLRGNELAAVSYELRLMRLLGGDVFGQLRQVMDSLRRNGLHPVVEACEVLYGSHAAKEAAVHNYLMTAYQRGLSSQARDWEFVDDRRKSSARVAIIVSLYRAEPKLRLFLTAIAEQTLVRRGVAELVLVDSGSPSGEYAVAKALFEKHSLNAVYARSRQRETIQSAWNRGIHIARAPYLVFLGVDETLYPEGLDALMRVLDSNPSVDWVMANSLVTEVDEDGLFKRDIMPYDRTGGTKDHAYLETCYLSWVGGMYRKSIHERFGYYDETFRAAGDTEFKNRVLPYINVKFLPSTLGLFLNYPDDRTTASPLAEIEDTRAWYIHRSPGGIRYAFGSREPDEALRLFYAALGYRKSYCKHISSDLEFALCLLRYARNQGSARDLGPIASDLETLIENMRRIDWTDQYFSRLAPAALLATSWRAAARFGRQHARRMPDASPTYKLLNDNRYEQHFWLWRTSSAF